MLAQKRSRENGFFTTPGRLASARPPGFFRTFRQKKSVVVNRITEIMVWFCKDYGLSWSKRKNNKFENEALEERE